MGPEGAGRWRHHQATTASPDREYLVEGAGGLEPIYHCFLITAVTLVLELMHLLQSVHALSSSVVHMMKEG